MHKIRALCLLIRTETLKKGYRWPETRTVTPELIEKLRKYKFSISEGRKGSLPVLLRYTPEPGSPISRLLSLSRTRDMSSGNWLSHFFSSPVIG